MKDLPGQAPSSPAGIAGRIAALFIDSKLTPLIVIGSLLLGLFAVVMLPREEEPQIKVPMVDVIVSMPGFTAKEVEERATRPMEKLLWEIPGVEYIYSTSLTGESRMIVRFEVGKNPDESLVRLTEKLRSNFDRIPPGVGTPLVKMKTIDDVPILAVTLHSKVYDHLTLRRLAAQIEDTIRQVPLVGETQIIGGARRQVRVLLDPAKLASRNLTPAGIVPMLRQGNRQDIAGAVTKGNAEVMIETGGFLHSAAEVGDIVVGVSGGKPVYLKDVSEVKDGTEESSQYVLYGRGGEGSAGNEAAVTISVAKRPGANAVDIARKVLHKIDLLKGTVLSSDVEIDVTRNYGKTAADKSNELLFHMGIAVISVTLLILFTLGWRESLIVAVAIPSTLALTLLVFYLMGFTLNRITLFALIFSIGILVDDAIVVVENIVRHFHKMRTEGTSLRGMAVEAVAEVGNPTILATFAVVFAILPMAFVGGLMGPYMRPIPIGASSAMLFSLLIAFMVTPWAAIRVLRWRNGLKRLESHGGDNEAKEDFFTRIYRRYMGALISSAKRRWEFLGAIVVLLLLAMGTVAIGWVKVKMLPFDNKSEFQVILNMPEGTSLERTAQVCLEIGQEVAKDPEVTDYQVYAGTAAPFNFNGLVRHYFTRRGSNVGDLQINLRPKDERKVQSHEIAKRLRPSIAAVAAKHNGRVAVAEVPPGPPVLQTLVTEVYGPTEEDRIRLACRIIDIYKQTPGVVDVHWYIETDQPKVRFVVDKEKAALHGISAETISRTLRMAVGGDAVDLLHIPREKEDVTIVVQLPRSLRTTPEELLALRVRSGDANALPEAGNSSSQLVPLRELVRLEDSLIEKSIHHKNLHPVTYVVGDVAGVVESPVYAILKMNAALAKLDTKKFGGDGAPLPVYNATLPESDAKPALKWDGEWHITIEVFRDLGSAFGVVLILIYILMVGWFRSFMTPLIVMAAIPFSLVGILPAHGFMHAFFTAPSMIGFMAGAGIVIRNSIILVDFIEQRVKEGMNFREAVVDAGAVRFRPMMLTAMAVVVGGAVILSDPIFQGLAISLMAGEIASLLISRMAVPVLYFMAYRNQHPENATPRITQ
jgi:multidrug efflux pump subunit AcrB